MNNSNLQQSAILQPLQDGYLMALCLGSSRDADRVVESALDAGVSAGRIYLDIFQPTAYTLGHLWQCNEISVAQEHLATAIIERQMGELHPCFKPQQERQRTIVIGCVEQELHRVGCRMVADFFQRDGWVVHYLGASVPTDSFVAMAREMSADLIGLSSQMTYSLPHVKRFVEALDRHGMAGIPVIAGGMPFIQQRTLYRSLGLVGCGTDAADAVHKANAYLGLPDENLCQV
jgi:MerR family transcriptional regulator, light-induced transcriptional regulator